MKKKLSQTPHAIRMRKLRREESPKAKKIRLLKRYIGLNTWRVCFYPRRKNEKLPPSVARLFKRVQSQKAELKRLLGEKK